MASRKAMHQTRVLRRGGSASVQQPTVDHICHECARYTTPLPLTAHVRCQSSARRTAAQVGRGGEIEIGGGQAAAGATPISFLKRQVQSERKNKSKYCICELYSRPCMCFHAQTHEVTGGWSIDKDFRDPVTGRAYDLRNMKDQNEVRQIVKRDKPLVITVSPPCTVFSIAYQGPICP